MGEGEGEGQLLGEREHCREDVLQDCNSYIKVRGGRWRGFRWRDVGGGEVGGGEAACYCQDYLEKNNLLRSCREFVRECQASARRRTNVATVVACKFKQRQT